MLPPSNGDNISRFERNVSFATVFAKVTVGVDEIEDEASWAAQPGSGTGKLDSYLSPPGAEVPAFERGWAMAPRECLDWFQAEADGASVMIGSSVGMVDWIDRSGQYGADQVVLAPEMLMHTNGNAGPFTNETGDHSFFFSIFPTEPGWRNGWQHAVSSQTPLTAVRKTGAHVNVNLRGANDEEAPGTSLGPDGSFLSLDQTNLWVSAVKREQPMSAPWKDCPQENALECAPRRGGLVVRLFDNEGLVDTANAQLRLFVPVRGIVRTNLIEQYNTSSSGDENIGGGISVGHNAIETFKLDVGLDAAAE